MYQPVLLISQVKWGYLLKNAVTKNNRQPHFTAESNYVQALLILITSKLPSRVRAEYTYPEQWTGNPKRGRFYYSVGI